MYDSPTPAGVALAFWRWFWVGVGALALIAGLILGCWQAGWWFQSHNATRQAENTQNGYSNQTTLRQQVTSQLAAVYSLTAQIAEANGNQSLIAALKPQRMAVAGIVCADAAQISGTPLPDSQAQWAAANCSAGVVSPGSSLYTNGSQ
jgi:hypothetical protein